MHLSALMTAASIFVAAAAAPAAQQAQSAQQPRSQQAQPGQEQRQDAAPANQRDRMPSANEQRVKAMQPSAQVRGQQPVQVALVTEPGRIANTPEAYYGVPVSVHGQVAAAYNTHSFAIESDTWWPGADNVLVLLPQPASGAVVNANEFVTVVGTVLPFVRTELERDYDWFDFDNLPDINIELEGRPVVVADLARTSSGRILTQPTPQTTRVLIATPGEIAQTPGRFYGRTVAVRQEVEDVWSSRAFTLDEDQWFAGPDLLVFNSNPIFTGRDDFDGYDGSRVTVFGTVRPLIVSEFEQDYDWFNAADYEAFGLDERERRPVVIASSIVSDAGVDLVRFTPELALDRAERGLASRQQRWPEMTARYDRPNAQQGTQAREPQTRMGAQQQPNQPANQQPQTAAAIRDLDTLAGQNAGQMIGRRVQLDRVRVHSVLGNNLYMVGPDSNRAVAIRVNQQMPNPIAVGDYLQLAGTVMQASGQTNLSGPVYVDTQQVSRVP